MARFGGWPVHSAPTLDLSPMWQVGMNRFSKFIHELRRRRVFRVAVGYGVIAWAIMEVGDLVLPALGLPSWTVTLVVVLALLGFPMAILLAWAFDITPEGVVRTDLVDRAAAEARERLAGVGPAGEVTPDAAVGGALPAEERGGGIVVLPFENLGPNDEDEYFSDGVTEDLITKLYKIESLRVISRSSAWQYKTSRAGARQIADELGVDYLLEGSVRRSGSRVRVATQLVDARSDRHLWAETFDRELEDIFAIQSEIAERIADALRLALSGVSGGEGSLDASTGGPRPDSAGEGGTSDLEAYDLFLKGRHLWNRRSEATLSEGVSFLEAAIERDPNFAQAHAALAEAYVTLAIYGVRSAQDVLPLARREADAALARHAADASALSALACVRAVYDWDWEQARAGFVSAMRTGPQYATAPQWLAMTVLVPLRKFDEAVHHIERARELDPLSPAVQSSFGVVDFFRGNYHAAGDRFDFLAQREPGFQFAYYFGGLSRLHEGDSGRALKSLERAMETGGWSAEIAAALGCAQVAGGMEEKGRETLSHMIEESEHRYVSPVRLALLQSALSEHESALESLVRAVETRATDLIWLDVHPGFDALRDERRFQEVRRQVFEEPPEAG